MYGLNAHPKIIADTEPVKNRPFAIPNGIPQYYRGIE
jgi:hypothetical protein